MRNAFLFLSLLFYNSAASQEKVSRDSLDFYLSKINNSSVVISYQYFPAISVDSMGKIICRNMNDYVIQRLINNLSDTTRALISHVLLTQSFEFYKPKLRLDHAQGEPNKLTYFNFSWVENDDGVISMIPQELKEICKYWIKRHLNERMIVSRCLDSHN